MRSVFVIILMLPLVAFGASQNASWHNKKNDDAWTIMKRGDVFHLNRRTNKKTSQLEFRENGSPDIAHPVNIFYNVTVLSQDTVTDGKGIRLHDANGGDWFISIDDGEGEYLIYDEVNRKPIAAERNPPIIIGKNYNIHITITKNHISLKARDESGNNIKIKSKVNVSFPIRVNIQCQRSGADFRDVKITSYLHPKK